MSRSPRLSDDEIHFFRQSVAGATPLHSNRVHHEPPAPLPIPRQRWRDDHEALHESLHAPLPVELLFESGEEAAYLRAGIAKEVLRDLRRGRWVTQAELDLHGANRHEAKELLTRFLSKCLERKLRCVRIIHGKGLRSPGREPILKNLTQVWLVRREDVLAFSQARAADGGSGALVVLLRSSTLLRRPSSIR